MDRISIILPIYNVEEYLTTCLKSVINQTYNNLEIICVNDGSTDNTLKIIEELATKDERIKIINKQNGGISDARNVGIEQAKGEYIIFIDSDDWVENDMVQKLYENIVKTDSDVAICGANTYNETNNELNDADKNFGFANQKFIKERPLKFNDFKDDIFSIPVMAWGKIYKTNLIKQNNLRFIKGVAFEDNPWTFDWIFKAKSISFCPANLYNYRVNRLGSDVSSAGIKHLDFIKNLYYVKHQLEKNNIYDELYNKFLNHITDVFLHRFNEIKADFKLTFYKNFLDFLKKEKINLETSSCKKMIYKILSKISIKKSRKNYKLKYNIIRKSQVILQKIQNLKQL